MGRCLQAWVEGADQAVQAILHPGHDFFEGLVFAVCGEKGEAALAAKAEAGPAVSILPGFEVVAQLCPQFVELLDEIVIDTAGGLDILSAGQMTADM